MAYWLAGSLPRRLRVRLSLWPPRLSISVGIDYADWFGLWLNLERVKLQKAVAVGRGVYAAFTDQDLTYEWGEVCSQFEEEYEAFRILAETNAERQEIRMQKRTGWR